MWKIKFCETQCEEWNSVKNKERCEEGNSVKHNVRNKDLVNTMDD